MVIQEDIVWRVLKKEESIKGELIVRNIDADRLKEVLWRNFGHTGGAFVLEQLIDAQPTINAIKQGKWLPICEDWRKQMEGNECSECGYKYFGDAYKYCPNCGAEMEMCQ